MSKFGEPAALVAEDDEPRDCLLFTNSRSGSFLKEKVKIKLNLHFHMYSEQLDQNLNIT
jgi:hypothetical protein